MRDDDEPLRRTPKEPEAFGEFYAAWLYGTVVVTVPDGIGKVEIGFDGESFGTSVAKNAALVRVDPWPEGRGTVTWNGGEVPLKSPGP